MTAPLLLWLNGGPGVSSLLGLFAENGPFDVADENGRKLRHRADAWTDKYIMLYVDQPVGTGFRFTNSDNGYARNMRDVTRDFLEFLRQFFKLFDNLRNNEFYLIGESYAGRYLPSIGAALVNDRAAHSWNVKGIMLGNAYIDPINQVEYAELLYNIGECRITTCSTK